VIIVYLYRFLTRLESLLWIWLLALAAITIWGIGSLVQGLDYTLLVTVTVGGMALGRILARMRAPWWLGLPVMLD